MKALSIKIIVSATLAGMSLAFPLSYNGEHGVANVSPNTLQLHPAGVPTVYKRSGSDDDEPAVQRLRGVLNPPLQEAMEKYLPLLNSIFSHLAKLVSIKTDLELVGEKLDPRENVKVYLWALGELSRYMTTLKEDLDKFPRSYREVADKSASDWQNEFTDSAILGREIFGHKAIYTSGSVHDMLTEISPLVSPRLYMIYGGQKMHDRLVRQLQDFDWAEFRAAILSTYAALEDVVNALAY